jgi:hypothetical protein
MRLWNSLLIAKGCYLDTVDEAVCNIDYHAMNIFEYSKLNQELQELYDDVKKHGFTGKELIDDIYKKVDGYNEDDWEYEKYSLKEDEEFFCDESDFDEDE